MKKKTKRRKAIQRRYMAYCLVFLAVCAVPSVMMLFPNHSTGKRIQTKFPSFQNPDGSWNEQFGSDLTAYVSEHFGFRQELANIDSKLKSNLFQTSTEKDVIVGKHGWLYDRLTLNDYVNQSTISEHGLQNIAYNLKMLQDYTESKGAKFLTAIVPNKNTVYPEYMPKYIKPSPQDGNLEHLTKALESTDVSFLNLTDTLISAKSTAETPIYYRKDTYWNNTGALVAYRAMMEKMGIPYEAYEDAEYVTAPAHQSELWQKLYPTSKELENENTYAIEFHYDYQGHYQSLDDTLITTLNTNQERTDSLLMFRDSFGAEIIPYFSEQFRLAKYSSDSPYSLYDMESQEYHAVVVQTSESEIENLQGNAPIHGAPYAEDMPEFAEEVPELATAYIEEVSGVFVHVWGAIICPKTLTGMENYYVTIKDNDGKEISYLSYHCYEKDKFKDTQIRDNGYSMYIPTPDLSPEQRYELTLTVQGKNFCYCCPIGAFTT